MYITVRDLKRLLQWKEYEFCGPDPLSITSPMRLLEETYNARSESMQHFTTVTVSLLKIVQSVFFRFCLIDYRYVENK